jgi:hypothetical protein
LDPLRANDASLFAAIKISQYTAFSMQEKPGLTKVARIEGATTTLSSFLLSILEQMLLSCNAIIDPLQTWSAQRAP